MSTAVEMTTVGRPDAAAAVTEVCDATDEPMLLDDKPATPPLQVPLDIVTGPVDGPEIPQPDVEMKELIGNGCGILWWFVWVVSFLSADGVTQLYYSLPQDVRSINQSSPPPIAHQ